MQGQLFHNTALAIAMLFSSLAVAEAPSRDMVAVATYKGQAEKLGSMPPMFKASARFKTNKATALCPEAMQYQKLTDESFLTPVDHFESYMRSADPAAQAMGQEAFEFHLDSEICQTLEPDTEVEVVAAYLPVTGCMKAWMPSEYNRRYPNTSSYSCFYIPAVMSGGKLHMVPGIHLTGFDQWAAEEWQKHSRTQ